jgi:hypothetical protein
MTKVYVVTQGSYSDYRITALFSTRELAEMFISTFSKPYSDFNDVVGYDLDQFEEQIREGLQQIFVIMNEDGTTTHTYGMIPSQEDIVCEIKRSGDGTLYLHIVTWARDEQHAIKIANERRSALIASNQFKEGRL